LDTSLVAALNIEDYGCLRGDLQCLNNLKNQ